MIKWLKNLFRDPLDIQYNDGVNFAKIIWDNSPPTIARETLIRNMRDVNKPYEIGIYDFLKSKDGEK